MVQKDESYAFPWGFHIGELSKEEDTIPLYTFIQKELPAFWAQYD